MSTYGTSAVFCVGSQTTVIIVIELTVTFARTQRHEPGHTLPSIPLKVTRILSSHLHLSRPRSRFLVYIFHYNPLCIFILPTRAI